MRTKIIAIMLSLTILSVIFCSCSATEEKMSVPVKTKDAEVQEDTSEIYTTRIIIDMAGRQHKIPVEVDKVFCTNPVGTTLIYTLAPEKLIAWNYQFNEHESNYIAEGYKDLPVFGTIKTANFEALISAAPDFIISAAGVDEKTANKIDDFQEQLGIPIIMVDESLTLTSEVYLFLGEILGSQERAAILSEYASTVLNKVNSTKIDETERVSVYFGNGINSLNTSSFGTPPSQVFDLLQAVNVCQLQGESPDRIEVTPEHILEWNPDFIFINGEPTENISGATAASEIIHSENYRNVKAVKNDNVVNIPNAPFAWLDRPRSVNRLIGLLWAGNIMYPDYYEFSNDDIIEFYKLFYHIKLEKTDIEILLKK